MGVEFFPCHYCSESICDCGEYVSCDCRRKWCTLDCAVEEGFYYDEEDQDTAKCNFCQKRDVEDSELVKFLLEKLEVSRDEAVKEYYDATPDLL